MLRTTIKSLFYIFFGAILAGCYQNSAYYEPNQRQQSSMMMANNHSGMSDEMISNQVRNRIANRGFMGRRANGYPPINVVTKNGVVYLSGRVNTLEEKSNIIRNAYSVAGVKSVKSTIKIT